MSAWVLKRCHTCRDETVHEITEGTNKRARWKETVCLSCRRVRNVTVPLVRA